jgi:ribosomal protein S18 acetylase RimI-like enzyme
MDMYIEYLKERRPECQVEICDKGFAIYSFMEDSVYIEEIYVKPEYRQEHIATQLSGKIQEKARQMGCVRLLGSVSPSAQGSTKSLQVLLAHGMTLLSSQDDLIWFSKPL